MSVPSGAIGVDFSGRIPGEVPVVPPDASPRDDCEMLDCLRKTGAGDRTRTDDLLITNGPGVRAVLLGFPQQSRPNHAIRTGPPRETKHYAFRGFPVKSR